jgi:hypothetical protein
VTPPILPLVRGGVRRDKEAKKRRAKSRGRSKRFYSPLWKRGVKGDLKRRERGYIAIALSLRATNGSAAISLYEEEIAEPVPSLP